MSLAERSIWECSFIDFVPTPWSNSDTDKFVFLSNGIFMPLGAITIYVSLLIIFPFVYAYPKNNPSSIIIVVARRPTNLGGMSFFVLSFI